MLRSIIGTREAFGVRASSAPLSFSVSRTTDGRKSGDQSPQSKRFASFEHPNVVVTRRPEASVWVDAAFASRKFLIELSYKR